MLDVSELGTMNLAIRKLTPLPSPFNSCPMAVAVTLSCGGNQAEDTAGGAEQKMMPDTPFRAAEMWQKTVNRVSSRSG